jgi:hypothetical protein
MALVGNRSVILKSPGRFLSGAGTAGTGIGIMRSAFSNHGMVRSSYQAFDAKAAIPYGHLSGSAWVLPKTAGGISSHHVTTLTAVATGLAVGGITANGEASITFTVADADGQLISSGEGSATFSITAADLLLTASLNGVGEASFAITASDALLGALASGDGTAAITFTVPAADILPLDDASPLRDGTATITFSGTLEPYAIGIMEGSTVDNSTLTTASLIAAMNAAPPAVNIKKVNDVDVTGVGSVGDPWGPP